MIDKAIDHSTDVPSSQIPSAGAFGNWDKKAKDLYLMVLKRTMLMFALMILRGEIEVMVENSGNIFKAKSKVINDLGWSKYADVENKDVTLPVCANN